MLVANYWLFKVIHPHFIPFSPGCGQRGLLAPNPEAGAVAQQESGFNGYLVANVESWGLLMTVIGTYWWLLEGGRVRTDLWCVPHLGKKVLSCSLHSLRLFGKWRVTVQLGRFLSPFFFFLRLYQSKSTYIFSLKPLSHPVWLSLYFPSWLQQGSLICRYFHLKSLRKCSQSPRWSPVAGSRRCW